MNENRIIADPTKEFFISMLTRDISTDRAILDLIDNSIDASLKQSNHEPTIKITINPSTFIIEDNCGGLDLEVAKNYAFRFGRDTNAPKTPNSVGQFGVGMKRTLFKLGTNFQVKSRHNNIAYSIDVDVSEWVERKEWDFYFKHLEKNPPKEGTTIITVSKLREDVRDLFATDSFLFNLEREISIAYFEQIHNGIKILFNDRTVKSQEILIKTSETLGAIKKSFTYDDVEIKITCGITDRKLEDGGWYVICNGRLVTDADQSEITGWGVDGTRQYHADFAFFRGLVEFSCEDSSKLPWTTTKTGVDRDSKVYKFALHHMNLCMQPILSLLRDRAEETTKYEAGDISSKPIAECIEHAQTVRIQDIAFSDKFTRPLKISTPKKKKNEIKISYSVPIEKFEEVKSKLNAATQKQVGERTFDYYYTYECTNE